MAATLGGGAAPAAGEGGRDTTPVGATGEPRRALRGPRRGRARRREPSARRPPHQAAKRAPRGGCYRRRGGRQRILARRSLPRGSGKVYKRPRRRRGVGAATAIEGGKRHDPNGRTRALKEPRHPPPAAHHHRVADGQHRPRPKGPPRVLGEARPARVRCGVQQEAPVEGLPPVAQHRRHGAVIVG